MEDPVMLVETGQTYDRLSIEDWFARGYNTCPLTGQTMSNKMLVPNFAVKRMIGDWVDLNCPGASVVDVRSMLNSALAATETNSAVSSVAPSLPLTNSQASGLGNTASQSALANIPAQGPQLQARQPVTSGAAIPPVPPLDQQLGGLSLGDARGSNAGSTASLGGHSHHRAPSASSTGFFSSGLLQPDAGRGSDSVGSPPGSAQGGAALHYPPISAVPDGVDRVAATLDILSRLTAASRDVDEFRKAADLHLWQLQELAKDDECKEVMMTNDVVALLLQVFRMLPASDPAAHAATCIARLALQGRVACQQFVHLRAVDHLVAMLVLRHEAACRRAATTALTYLGWNCVLTKQEIIVKLCQEVKHSQNNTNIVLAFRECMASLELPDAEVAACALHMLSEAVQPNVLEYFSTKGTRLTATLAMALDKGSSASSFAAVCAMKNLSTTPYNRQAVLEELVGLLANGSVKGREQAAWLLWELAYNSATGSSAPVVAALARCQSLPAALGDALSGEAGNNLRELAAGVVQLLTYKDPQDRDTNRLVADVDVDAIRFSLAAPGTTVAPWLGSMLATPRAATQARVIATYALSNLAAVQSPASCAACGGGGGAKHLLKKGTGEMCVHNPRMAVACQPAVLATAYDMLYSRNAPEIAAAVALLNNLCVTDETRDKVKLEAKKIGTDRVRQRLLELIADQQLSEMTKTGIRTVLMRFDRHRPVKIAMRVICRALKPPKRNAVFRDP